MTHSLENDRDDTVSYQMDMIRSAKDAQWTPDFLSARDVVKVISPSKVNLFLSVGDKRADGYHDVVNVMHTLALHDTLYLGIKDRDDAGDVAFAGPAKSIAVRIDICDKTASPYDAPLDIPVQENLVFKAIDLLAHAIGYNEDVSIDVRIEKNIPSQAGLAGGSSDAAAALVGCAKLWGASDPGRTLQEAAMKLGADVSFFLEGGCCEFVGHGEEFSRRIEPMKLPVVLVKPDIGVATKRAYEVLDSFPQKAPLQLLAQVSDATSAAEVPLFNSFDEIALQLDEGLVEVARWLSEQKGVLMREGKALCMLSGSGAATFAITDSFSDAARIAGAAKAKGLWARATTFCSLRATVA